MNLNKKNTRQLMLLIAFAALMIWIANNYMLFIDFLGFMLKIIIPLILGCAIAFILNLPMSSIERRLFKSEKIKRKPARILSLIISIILIIGVVGIIMFLVIPEFIDALISISKEFPKALNWFQNLLEKLTGAYPIIQEEIKKIGNFDISKTIISSMGNVVTITMNIVTTFVSSLITLIIGLVFSIYILLEKEKLVLQIKKVMKVLLPETIGQKIIGIAKITGESFSNFLTGQCVEACILGMIFFIVMTIFNFPYALIVGVLITITALIPFVGPFITLVIGFVLIAVVSPIKAFWFILLFLVLQQIEENFIYPRIVGKSVGLPAIWTLVAITIGGSIFGLLGILVSVPISSILYSLFRAYINEKTEKESIDKS
ncbi:MAG: AI-2E family transporter [Bacilli bacterium]